MAEVQNETEEGVEYGVEEGEGTSSFTLRVPLASGGCEELEMSTQFFNISFYPAGGTGEVLISQRDVHRDSTVRLYRSKQGRLALDVQPAKEAA